MKVITINSPVDLQMEDLDRILSIFDEISQYENDLKSAEAITDELHIYQPFLLSILMGYKFDLSPEELGEALTLYIAIWEYFKIDSRVKSRKITDTQFERLHNNNMQLLVKNDPANMEDVAILFNVIVERFMKRPVLSGMGTKSKAALMIGTKSIIECFQELTIE